MDKKNIGYCCQQSVEVTKFWMVIKGLGQGANVCVQRHETLTDAEEEAARLCRKTGEAFYILEAVQIVEAMTPPVTFRKV